MEVAGTHNVTFKNAQYIIMTFKEKGSILCFVNTKYEAGSVIIGQHWFANDLM